MILLVSIDLISFHNCCFNPVSKYGTEVANIIIFTKPGKWFKQNTKMLVSKHSEGNNYRKIFLRDK